jgi:transposase-like protein
MYALREAAFRDEESAYRFVEERVWPNGPVCPHCGGAKRIGKLKGKSTRIGTYKCYTCRKPFTVKMGTVWEDSHVPLHLWLQAVYLLCTTRSSVNIHRLQRTLGVTLNTACFMAERICGALPGNSDQSGDRDQKGEATATDDENEAQKPLPKAQQLVRRIRARALASHSTRVLSPAPGAPFAESDSAADILLQIGQASLSSELSPSRPPTPP